jgi:hypothetical protein
MNGAAATQRGSIHGSRETALVGVCQRGMRGHWHAFVVAMKINKKCLARRDVVLF